MGNLIIAGSFVDYPTANITVRSENASYPKENVKDYWYLKKQFRAADYTKNDWLWKVQLSAQTDIAAILINDTNIDKIYIDGNTSDSWPNSPTNFTISKDPRVQRYKAWCALTSFDYSWIRIGVQSGAADPLDGGSAWRIGTIVILENDAAKTITLSQNITYPLNYGAMQGFQDTPKLNKSKERIGFSQDLVWFADVVFGSRDRASYESDFWALNALDIAQPVVVYENEGSTQYAYLCTRDGTFQAEVTQYNIINAKVIRFTELV